MYITYYYHADYIIEWIYTNNSSYDTGRTKQGRFFSEW